MLPDRRIFWSTNGVYLFKRIIYILKTVYTLHLFFYSANWCFQASRGFLSLGQTQIGPVWNFPCSSLRCFNQWNGFSTNPGPSPYNHISSLRSRPRRCSEKCPRNVPVTGVYPSDFLFCDSKLPCWLSGRESTYNAGDSGSLPGLGRSPGGGRGNPLQYSRLENPMGRGAWRATVHRVIKRWTWLKQLGTCQI